SFNIGERLGSGVTINNVPPRDYQHIWVRAEDNGSLSPIPAPCPSYSNAVMIDLSDLVYEGNPASLISMDADNDLFCDNASATIVVDGVLNGRIWNYDEEMFEIITSPYSYFLL